jgi:hypothetical protein
MFGESIVLYAHGYIQARTKPRSSPQLAALKSGNSLRRSRKDKSAMRRKNSKTYPINLEKSE